MSTDPVRPLRKETVGPLTVKVFHDPDATTPREWSNISKVTLFGNNSRLGDEPQYRDDESLFRELLGDERYESIIDALNKESNAAFAEWKASSPNPATIDGKYRELAEDLANKTTKAFCDAISETHLVIPLNDGDSGLRTGAKSGRCPDGYAYVPHERLLEEYGTERVTEEVKQRASAAIETEIATLNAYIQGNTYGFTVEDESGECLSTSWGFYDEDYCMGEGKSDALRCVSARMGNWLQADERCQELAQATLNHLRSAEWPQARQTADNIVTIAQEDKLPQPERDRWIKFAASVETAEGIAKGMTLSTKLIDEQVVNAACRYLATQVPERIKDESIIQKSTGVKI